ncbi:Outer membrane protein TolC [Zobellia uliginosa]|uniref:Outer membrane protein TolC n=1 Tax=Zobellia uliginosa TaxID=143224 RepID=A0ABY1KJC1_9FLAO|nr:TolC family protein [Zobellia uliginosa]SIS41231.1 Outer membrane protein TolC [Zobellia uliginosa]
MITAKMAGQEVYTLDECVTYALKHNLQMRDYDLNALSGRESYRQSIRDLLPSLIGSSNYVINFGRSTDPFTNDVVTTDFFSNRYTLETSVDLYRGFQKQNTIRATKLLYKATQEEALQQRYLLAFRVMQAFYDIKFFKGLVAISKEQVAVSQANYDLVVKQIELGMKAGADLYEAESLLLSDKLNLTQSENRLVSAKLQLIQEMNLEGANDIEIRPNLEFESALYDESLVQSDSIYGRAKEFLPLLKAQELRVKAAKKQLAAERGALFPSLSLFAGTATGYFETTRDSLANTIPFRDQFRDNTSQFVGFSLNVPISNIWAARGRIKQQKIERLRAENNMEIQHQVVFETIRQLVQEYRSLEIQREQSSQKVKAQELAFTIAQKRYEKGLINALELFTAKNLFASAQNENLQVSLRSEINRSTLNFYKGLPVFNIGQ